MPKLIQYRDKCIGCNVCFEQQPELWRMSKKDGKATLVKSFKKKNVFILDIPDSIAGKARQTERSCPVRIIKVK